MGRKSIFLNFMNDEHERFGPTVQCAFILLDFILVLESPALTLSNLKSLFHLLLWSTVQCAFILPFFFTYAGEKEAWKDTNSRKVSRSERQTR